MGRVNRHRDLVVGPLRAEEVEGRRRVTASVAGRDVWFESSDAAPARRPEAFLGPFLVPALERGVRLRHEGEVDPAWLRGAREVTEVFRGWWGYPGPDPLDSVAAGPGVETGSRPDVSAGWSGGVDSSYTIFRAPRRIDVLVFVHGFDVRIRSEERASAFRRSLEEVAAATGRRPVVLRTNLREHPVFRGAPWERTHGGALAAVGHALSDEVGTHCVSSTWARSDAQPWGSHFETDEAWSSRRLRIAHVGTERTRWEKLWAIQDEPLVRRHLRVCWQNRARTGNCGRCEKCLRTRVTLARTGRLEAFAAAFPQAPPLVAAIDALPPLAGIFVHAVWAPMGAWGDLESDLQGAVERLVARSVARERPGVLGRVTRRAGRTWRRLRRHLDPDWAG